MASIEAEKLFPDNFSEESILSIAFWWYSLYE
jgi:hypothetical protein